MQNVYNLSFAVKYVKKLCQSSIYADCRVLFFGILVLYIQTLFVVLQNFFNFGFGHNLIP